MEPSQQTSKKEDGEPPTELKLGDIIGHGGFGVIFCAHSRKFGNIAVKIIFQPPTPESQKIHREALVMNQAPHDNIVSIKHFFQKAINEKEIQEIFGVRPLNSRLSFMKNFAIEGANTPRGMQMTLICMQLCGKTVAEWIAATPQKEDLSTKLLQVGICVGTRDGLKFLHDKGIVHRDLKPLNIMFSLDEQEFMLPVKIGDFGLARFLHTEESLTSNVGTLAYMAPEVLTKKYDQQSDLYSLGCVMWEVLSLLSARERQNRWHQVSAAKGGTNMVEGHTYLRSIDEDILNLVVADSTSRTKSINDLKFVSSVTHLFVSSTYELRLALQVATDGAVIQLAKGTYKGKFQIKQNRLRMVGAGEGTIFTGDSTILHIVGTGCVLLHFLIVGDGKSTGIFIASNNCCLAHLKVLSHDRGIQLSGNNSYLTWLDIRNVKYGIVLQGSEHLVKNCCIHEVIQGVTAYCSKGEKRTVISGLGYSSCTFALHLDSGHFVVDNIYALNSQSVPHKTSLTTIQISTSNSMLYDVDISNDGHIYFLTDSADCVLVNSTCGRLTVDGKRNLCSDVNVHGTIELLGSSMEIRNCKFQSMTASGTSNFGSVTVGEEKNMAAHQLYSNTHWKDVQSLLDISNQSHPSTVNQRLQEVAQEFMQSFQKSVERVLSNYKNAVQQGVKEYGPSNYPDRIMQREVQLSSTNFLRSFYLLRKVNSIAVKLSSGLMVCCFQGLRPVQTKVVRAACPNLPMLLSLYTGNHLLSTYRDAKGLGEVLIFGTPRTNNPEETTITIQVGLSGVVTVSATYGSGDAKQDLDVIEIVSSDGLEMLRPVC